MLSLFGLTVRVRGVVLASDAQSLCSYSEGEGGVVLASKTASLFGLTVRVRGDWS